MRTKRMESIGFLTLRASPWRVSVSFQQHCRFICNIWGMIRLFVFSESFGHLSIIIIIIHICIFLENVGWVLHVFSDLLPQLGQAESESTISPSLMRVCGLEKKTGQSEVWSAGTQKAVEVSTLPVGI